VKKIVLVLLALIILTVPLIGTSCDKLPQVTFEANPNSGNALLKVVFNNTTPDGGKNSSVVYDWDFGDGQTKTGASFSEVISHEYSKVGTYTITLICYNTKAPGKSTTTTRTVTVTHGALDTFTLTPETVELSIGQTQTFKTEAFDSSGNQVTDAVISWQSTGAGTITESGLFTAGNIAGIYSKDITVTAELDASKLNKSADVVIKPDPLETTTLESFTINAGGNIQLAAVAKDKHGNVLKGLETTWSMDNTSAGAITAGGLYTAPKKAGSFIGAIKVTVKQGDKIVEAIGNVTVNPGKMTQLEIAPGTINIGMRMTQQYYAVCADEYGNRISGVSYIWSTENNAGQITPNGLFTASAIPGNYQNGITVEGTKGDVTLKKNIRVNVENDRIVFLSSRNDPDDEDYIVYIMDADGSNEEKLNLSAAGTILDRIVSSADGQRLLYIDVVVSGSEMTDYTRISNTDGSWVSTVSSGGEVFEPSLSPDGEKLVYQSWAEDDAEICVMDIDGANIVKLTNDQDYDDYPDWSPDGRKIAYVHQVGDNDLPKIYIMNADGSGKQLVSPDISYNLFPQWSPDGKEILFQTSLFFLPNISWGIAIMNSDGTNKRNIYGENGFSCQYPRWSPDGSKIVFASNENDGQYDIYTVDKDGTNLTRLTTHEHIDYSPTWLNPKKGVEVKETSVNIHEDFDEPSMTAQELSTQVKQSVVRIEVTLPDGTASGTGFVIRQNGVILTNNHVISDAETIKVYFNDGIESTATVLARDMLHDMALIKVDKTGLPTLELSSLCGVESGQQVVVLGYPLGNQNVSVTSGLVSSIEFDEGRNTTWIQTDSAINPGNSGGPLMNMHGKVIGIVTAKIFGVGIEGMGYAIAADTVSLYLAALLREAGIS